LAEIKPYLIINLVLAGLIGLVFLYSGIFSAGKDDHPVPSFYEEITGKPSSSSGMSRAFSEIMRGNINSAREYNPDSPMIFAFFLIQGIQRLVVSLLLLLAVKKTLMAGRKMDMANRTAGVTRRTMGGADRTAGNRPLPGGAYFIRYLLPADVIVSGILFFYCFRGQIRAMIELLTAS
jgi:hypothetical protein